MVEFIAERIEQACRQSIDEGKALYLKYFVKPPMKFYEKYRAPVDTILITDGFEECISKI